MLFDSFKEGLYDVQAALLRPLLWLTPAYYDIVLRFRSSAIGPFWITLNTAIFISTLGFVFSQLFGQDISQYLPYLAVGFPTWFFLSSMINDSATLYKSNSGLIRNTPLPLFSLILRLVVRNMIMFSLNMIIMFLAVLLFSALSLSTLPYAIMGLIIQILSAFCFSAIIALITARFFDIEQIITSFLQIIFLVSPIMWSIDILEARGISRPSFVEWNPVYHYIELVRAPILGKMANYSETLFFSLGTLALLIVSALYLHGRYKRYVPLWV